MKFHKTLAHWFLENQRDLPWRQTKDPYRIWLSEVMLQQTRIAQGLPYYERFTKEFPTVYELAEASEEKVLKIWQGLGYYSRARNLHATAKYIAYDLNGEFPNSYAGLKKLKGVGDYTASAIASIVYQEPVAVVDGNVYRVLARYFGISTPINSTAGIKEFKTLATNLLDKKNPSTHNQALMEFGALQCKPKNPLCPTCPLQRNCVAYQQNSIADFPIKLKKTKVRTRHFNYLVLLSTEGKTVLQKRKEKGIWKNLYEFPLIETKSEIAEKKIIKHPEVKRILDETGKNIHLFNDKPIKHVLSHQKLFVKFWIVKTGELPMERFRNEAITVTNDGVSEFPVPVVLQNFIERFDFSK